MFVCSKCKAIINLPKCLKCGNEFEKLGGVWQLSDMPDMVVEGDNDKYIGYEHIGENYSGNRKYLIEDKDLSVAKEIAKLTKNGMFLDLACGDGCFTVPVASLGTKVIAGDISNTMLKVLQQKAEANNISLENVTVCRMNALEIPLADESVDTVVANGVLHLISNPEKVINEIYRVLKMGGCFICGDDIPGKEIESKCFYFLAGPFYRNQMEGLINRMTAQEFDNYLEYPRYARFRFVPAHIESI